MKDYLYRASTDLTGSRLGQTFTFTMELAAGDAAFFDLSGSVLAASVGEGVDAVPEPGAFGLAALGLFALVATRRRNGMPPGRRGH